METITDYVAWLDNVDTDDIDDLDSLIKSLSNVDAYGLFTTKKHATQDMWFVTVDGCDDVLMLASPKAFNAFVKHLEYNYGGELGIEAQNDFNKAMKKDD